MSLTERFFNYASKTKSYDIVMRAGISWFEINNDAMKIIDEFTTSHTTLEETHEMIKTLVEIPGRCFLINVDNSSMICSMTIWENEIKIGVLIDDDHFSHLGTIRANPPAYMIEKINGKVLTAQDKKDFESMIVNLTLRLTTFNDLMEKQVFISTEQTVGVRSKKTGHKINRKYNAVTINLSRLGVVKRDYEATGATGTGSPKRRHMVGSFLRTRNGKTHVVKEHFRGKADPDAPPIVHKVRGVTLH